MDRIDNNTFAKASFDHLNDRTICERLLRRGYAQASGHCRNEYRITHQLSLHGMMFPECFRYFSTMPAILLSLARRPTPAAFCLAWRGGADPARLVFISGRAARVQMRPPHPLSLPAIHIKSKDRRNKHTVYFDFRCSPSSCNATLFIPTRKRPPVVGGRFRVSSFGPARIPPVASSSARLFSIYQRYTVKSSRYTVDEPLAPSPSTWKLVNKVEPHPLA